MAESNTDGYKVRGRYFLLTYARCNAEKKSIGQVVWDLLPEENRQSVIVGKEPHKDGYPHIHIAVKLAGPRQYSDCHWADALGFHGNYMKKSNWVTTVMYVMKHDQEPFVIGEEPPNKKRKVSDMIADDLCNGMSLREVALKWRGSALQMGRNLWMYQTLVQATVLKREPLPKFVEDHPTTSPAGMIQNWIWKNLVNKKVDFSEIDKLPLEHIPEEMPFRTPQLYIEGFSGAGKTTTFNILEKRFKTFKPNTQQFFWDGFTAEHELIVFDEFMGKHISFELLKKILDGQKMSLVVKGGTVFKNKNIPVIIACNHAPAMNYEKHFQRFPAGEAELLGRLEVVTLTPPSYSDFNYDKCHIFQISQ